MALNSITEIGPGGTGYQGVGGASAVAALKELQGLSVATLAGAAANTKVDVAAIRSEDTILQAWNNNLGTVTDITGTMSINTLFASGTLTGTTVVITDTATVNGQVYTFQTAAATTYGQVQIGVDDNASMLNLKDAINLFEGSVGKGGANVVASVATNVVTVTASVEGAAGNSIAISAGQASIVASAANLANGTDTGGVQSTGITNQILLLWYNKQ